MRVPCSLWEERVLEMVMEALRISGLALALQALATFLLGGLLEHAVRPAGHSDARDIAPEWPLMYGSTSQGRCMRAGVAVLRQAGLWAAHSYFTNVRSLLLLIACC